MPEEPHTNARAALIKAVADANLVPADNIQWPNRPFVKTGAYPWMRVSYMPVTTKAMTLGTTGNDREVGILQLDLNVPVDSGDVEVTKLASKVRKSFPVGRRLIFSGQPVVIRSCEPSPGRSSGPDYRVSMTLTYYSELQREPI